MALPTSPEPPVTRTTAASPSPLRAASAAGATEQRRLRFDATELASPEPPTAAALAAAAAQRATASGDEEDGEESWGDGDGLLLRGSALHHGDSDSSGDGSGNEGGYYGDAVLDGDYGVDFGADFGADYGGDLGAEFTDLLGLVTPAPGAASRAAAEMRMGVSVEAPASVAAGGRGGSGSGALRSPVAAFTPIAAANGSSGVLSGGRAKRGCASGTRRLSFATPTVERTAEPTAEAAAAAAAGGGSGGSAQRTPVGAGRRGGGGGGHRGPGSPRPHSGKFPSGRAAAIKGFATPPHDPVALFHSMEKLRRKDKRAFGRHAASAAAAKGDASLSAHFAAAAASPFPYGGLSGGGGGGGSGARGKRAKGFGKASPPPSAWAMGGRVPLAVGPKGFVVASGAWEGGLRRGAAPGPGQNAASGGGGAFGGTGTSSVGGDGRCGAESPRAALLGAHASPTPRTAAAASPLPPRRAWH